MALGENLLYQIANLSAKSLMMKKERKIALKNGNSSYRLKNSV